MDKTLVSVLMILSALGGTSAVRPTLCDLGGKPYCVVTPPTACPANPLTNRGRFNCTILDLRVAVAAGPEGAESGSDNATEYGLLVRFIIPSPAVQQQQVGQGTPLLFRFHGTGGCGLEVPAAKEGCACSPDIPCSLADGCKDFQVAQEGVLVVKPAERGTSHCYGPDDPMSPSATWLGSLEFADYDTLLEAVIAHALEPAVLPAGVDAARIGVSGGSHGGIASFLYPVFSKAPSLPKVHGKGRFALAMPFEGTPDVATTWFGWQYDADTLARTGDPLAVGFAADAGAVPQVHAWPQSTLARLLAAAYATGNQSALVAFLAARTAYDPDPAHSAPSSVATERTLDTFDSAVGAMLLHLGGRDCIVPGYGTRTFHFTVVALHFAVVALHFAVVALHCSCTAL